MCCLKKFYHFNFDQLQIAKSDLQSLLTFQIIFAKKMTKNDFDGIQKYKIFILSVLCFLLLISFLGPLYFYETYFSLYLFAQKIILAKLFYDICSQIFATRQVLRILNKSTGLRSTQSTKKIFHAIILPVYNEEVCILKQTLSRLAYHKNSKTKYLIYLAMEAHSINPQQRASQLSKAFSNSFRKFSFTTHVLLHGEAQGKASNVNWCARQIQQSLKEEDIRIDDVLVTVIDCDNWVPNSYFFEVEQFLRNNNNDLRKYMFAPNQMYSVNVQNVNIINRCIDYLMGASLFSISNNPFRVHYAASNYSLGFGTIQQMGYFDTNPDAMYEDLHTSMKFIFHKKGKGQIIPIFVMLNSMTIETGKGDWEDLKARFTQNQRHLRNILVASYILRRLIKEKLTFKTLLAAIYFFLNTFIHFIFCSAAIILSLFRIIGVIQASLTEEEIFFFKAQFTIFSFGLLMFWYAASKSTKKLYNHKGGVDLLRFIEILLLYKIIVIIYTVTFYISSFKVVLGKPDYIAAVKNVGKSKPQ